MKTIDPCENIPVPENVTHVRKAGTIILGKGKLELH